MLLKAPLNRFRFLLLCACALGPACSLLAPSDDNLLGGGRTPNQPKPDTGTSGAPPAPDASDDVSDAGDEDRSEEDASTPCTDAAPCGDGLYCGDAGMCNPCSDLSSLASLEDVEFGEPVPLTAINETVGLESLRFPRAFGSPPKLLYVRDYFGGRIWLTPDMDSSSGSPLAVPIADPDPNVHESGPLLLEEGIEGFSGHNFFFDRSTNEPPTGTLQGASMNRSGMGSEVTPLPAPFNTGSASYALALSRTRAFWTQNLDGNLNIRLMTAPLEGDIIPAIVQIKLWNECQIIEFGYAPWVTPDGRILLLSFTEREDSCSLPDSAPHDLGIVRLDASGQPEHHVLAVRSVSQAGTSEGDGSLSSDMCWLYFVSNRDKAGQTLLYRARRVR
jgi:hypothetical protein